MKSKAYNSRSSGKQEKTKISFKQKLYTASLCICSFYRLKDFLFLQSDYFLDLCGVDSLQWNPKADWLNEITMNEGQSRPFEFSCPLIYKTSNYGELIFSSSQKIPQKKKNFLKKVSSLTASALYFIENKKKMEAVKDQWGEAFDSFPQAFCITDKNFKIIRVNQAFLDITETDKTQLTSRELFEVAPAIQAPQNKDKECSWITRWSKKGQETFWEISYKPLFSKIHTRLFLIKDITQEMEIEGKLSSQAKEKELGLIKGSIAHELNNPITGIKMLLSLIEKEVPPRQDLLKDSLREMQKAIDRCYRMVKHILFISQNTEKDRASLSLYQPNSE